MHGNFTWIGTELVVFPRSLFTHLGWELCWRDLCLPLAINFLDALSEKHNLPHRFWGLSLLIDYVKYEGLKASVASMNCICDDLHREIYVLYWE